MSSFIPLSVPNFCGNEKKYVDDALDGAWVSTSGAKVDEMEACVAQYLHMPRAVACASGSAALHLSALVAGVQRGDEVTLIGGDSITWEEAAEKVGTINYELTCLITARTRRIYVNED